MNVRGATSPGLVANSPDSQGALPGFDPPSPGMARRLQRFLHSHPTVVPFIVLLAGYVVFSLLGGSTFLSPFNQSLVLQQVTIIAILGIAQTLIILTAGIDLSVGAIMILASIIMGRLAVLTGLPPEISLAIGLFAAVACGFVNGVLVAFARLPPFIVTLGTWSMYGALVTLFSQSETIRASSVETAAPLLQWLGTPIRLGGGAILTYGSGLMIILAALVWYILNRTTLGRHIHASGDDPEAARLAGIDPKRTLVLVYSLAGLICGLAGWVVIGRIGAVSPLAGHNANLDAITAVVIGGTSLFGGRGSIVGTLIGALIVGIFRNGLAIVGVDGLWQEFTVGALIIVAVGIDQWLRRIAA